MKTFATRRCLALCCAFGLLGAACGDDAEVIDTGNGSLSPETYSEPLYVIQSLIFGAEGRASYVILRPELAAEPTISLSEAREFPEYSPADAIDGKLAVGSGESPSLAFFSISDGGTWTDEAARYKSPVELAALRAVREALDPKRIMNPRVLF